MAQTKRVKADKRMVHIRLEPELHRRLRIIVAAENTTMQDWLAGTVEQVVSEVWPAITDGGDIQ